MTDDGQLLVVHHGTRTAPGTLAEMLEAREQQRPWRIVALTESGGAHNETALVDPDRVRGMLVLGGPEGVADAARQPWLETQLELLETGLQHGITVLGVGVAARLLGLLLGGEVDRLAPPEVGFVALERTAEARDDPVFAGWPDGAVGMFARADRLVDLPPGAQPMLDGPSGVAGWRVGDASAYAVEFHPGVDAAELAEWTRRVEIRRLLAAAEVDADELTDEVRRREPFVRATDISLVGRWLDQVVGMEDRGPKRARTAH